MNTVKHLGPDSFQHIETLVAKLTYLVSDENQFLSKEEKDIVGTFLIPHLVAVTAIISQPPETLNTLYNEIVKHPDVVDIINLEAEAVKRYDQSVQ